MKGTFSFLATLILTFSPGTLSAEDATRENAIEIVTGILSPATLKHDARAFLTMTPLAAGDRIEPFGEPARGTTLTAPTWFAWIDDEPSAFYTHKVRFVLIDVATGNAKVTLQEWWPEVNGEPPFTRSAVQANPLLRIFSSLEPVLDRVQPVPDREQ